MSDSFELGQSNRVNDTVPLVPPSSSEVTIRTMASDLLAMGRSGGLPSAPPVVLEPFADSRPTVVHAPAPSRGSGTHHAVRVVMITVMVGVGALILFAIGFYVIPLLAR